MINACVISSKENVAFNMASVVCKSGAKCERQSTYSFEKVKSFNIAIIDLDNITEQDETEIKKTFAGFKDMIVVGISRDQAKMDDFSFCMQTIRKPLLTDHIKKMFADVKDLVQNNCTINNEANPVYTKACVNTEPTAELDTDVFSDEELSRRLSQIVNAHYDGPSEQEFLQQIELDKVEIKKEKVEIHVPAAPKVDIASQFIDDALMMYRAKKLKRLNLSSSEIKNRIKSLLMYDASRLESLDKSELSDKWERSAVINSLAEQNREPEMEVEHVSATIEDQRREAIYNKPYADTVGASDKVVNNDKYNDAELKYIKMDENSKAQQQPTALVPKSSPGIVIEQSELSEKAQKTMTPEQLAKLRKLGVKI